MTAARTTEAPSCELASTYGEIANRDDLLGLQVGQERPSRANPPVKREQIPDVERPPGVIALAGRRPRHGLEIPQIRRPRWRGRYELLVLVALLDEPNGRRGIARRDRPPPCRRQPASPDHTGRRQLALIGLVGRERVKIRDVELGILV